MEAAFKGAVERSREDWKRVAYGAHQAAAFSRVAAKRFPRLDAVLAQFNPRPAVTPERVLAAFARFTDGEDA